jgi:tetratricopeptide (TPR) repeat protein
MANVAERMRASRVWGVLAVYLGASWVVLQIVDVVKQNLGLPDWVFPFALLLLLIGLPIILATAFLQGRPPTASEEEAAAISEVSVRSDPGTASAGISPSGRHLFTWKNALLGGGLAFLFLASATGAFMYMRNNGIGPVGSLVAAGVLEEQARVVLSEFEAEDVTLERTVTESFRVDLAQSPILTLVEPDSIADALDRMGLPGDTELTEETARELALRDGIPAVIAGEIASLGAGFVLTARLVSATDGAVLASARASSKNSDGLVEAIDEVSAKLREQIGESYTSLRQTPSLAHVTTGSLEALKKYTQAYDARFRDEDPEAAIRLLEEAVEIDSTFALAWRDLATITDNINGSWDLQVNATEAAYRHRERLSERERYVVEASYHQDITEDYGRAIEAWESILRLDPNDAQALNNIGFNYWQMVDYENALAWYQKAYEAAPDHSLHLANVAVANANLGNFEAAEAAYAGLDSFPPNPGWAMWEAHFRWATGDEPAIREAVEAIQSEYPNRGVAVWAEGTLSALELVHGRIRSAVFHADRTVEQNLARDAPDNALGGLLDVAGWQLSLLGDTAAALAAVEAAIHRIDPEEIAPLDRPWGSIGNLLLRAGEIDRGREFMERDWNETPERLKPAREKYLAGDRASIARAEGRPEEALAELRTLPPWGCIPCRHRVTGQLFDEAGRADSAIAYYELYLETPYNFRLFVDRRWLGPTYERLGQLYDEGGDLENAALHYAAFVELWADADPVLQPRVRAAQARLEEIVSERG